MVERKTFKSFLLCASVAFILFTSPSNVLADAISYYGPYAGNDSEEVLNGMNLGDGLFDDPDWVFLQKVNVGGSTVTDVDVGLSVTSDGTSGEWSVSGYDVTYDVIAVVLKGGNNWVGYLYDPKFDDEIYGGKWTTAGLTNHGEEQPDLSHLSLYASGSGSGDAVPKIPNPEPTTMLLLGTGLIGLAGVRRKMRK